MEHRTVDGKDGGARAQKRMQRQIVGIQGKLSQGRPGRPYSRTVEKEEREKNGERPLSTTSIKGIGLVQW